MRKNTITKLIQTAVIIFLITEILLAQDILWQRVFDTGEADHAKGITTDSKDNIIVSCQSSREVSGGDCLTIKYNPYGDTIWTQWYDTTFYNGVDAVTSDCLGNIIIAGYMWTESTNADMHLVKYDPDGNILWTRTYSNGEKEVGEFCYGVATDSKNNIIIIGKAYYNWGDYITLKYDPNGNLLWMRTYDGAWEDYAQDVAVDGSDNIIVTGYSNGDMNWDWCTIKYSPEGDILWIRRYDVAETDWAFGVATDQDDNVIVAGETHLLLSGNGGCSAMVVKYSAQGDTLWTKIFTDTLQYAEVVSFADVVTDDHGNIYLVGEYFYWSDTGTSNNRSDYHIIKCDLNGDTLWTFTCDYDNEDEVSGIVLDHERNIVVTGETNHRYGRNEYDFLTIKLKDKGVNRIGETHLFPHKFVLHQNYPNPFNPITTVTFSLPEASKVKTEVYDLTGRCVAVLCNRHYSAGTYSVQFDGSVLASGVYILRFRMVSIENPGKSQVFARKMMLMK